MLRITEKFENKGVVRLRLDGTVSPAAADELWRLCARHHADGARKLVIDMDGVNFMSSEAAQKLARMRSRTLRVINCSPFIETLLNATSNLD